MSDPISQIKTRLKDYPQLRFEEGRGTIEVKPESEEGFPVSFADNETEFIVSFAGWHDHFSDVDDALKCFAFGLSNAARLKVYSRRGVEYKWVLEYQRDGKWEEDSTTGTFSFPFWCKRKVKYLQNCVLNADDAFST